MDFEIDVGAVCTSPNKTRPEQGDSNARYEPKIASQSCPASLFATPSAPTTTLCCDKRRHTHSSRTGRYLNATRTSQGAKQQRTKPVRLAPPTTGQSSPGRSTPSLPVPSPAALPRPPPARSFAPPRLPRGRQQRPRPHPPPRESVRLSALSNQTPDRLKIDVADLGGNQVETYPNYDSVL